MAKKIGAIVSLSLIGILIIVTIILANVKINYSINCETPTSIFVSYTSNGQTKVSNEQANKIVDYINNASKENTLTALFNGNLNKKAEITGVSGNKTQPTAKGFYVEYSYENPQKLMEGNKEYKDSKGNTVVYQRLVFTVNNLDEKAETTVCVYNKLDSQYYSHYYTVEANFYNLYNYLVECGLNS